jgi:hypothetical protein
VFVVRGIEERHCQQLIEIRRTLIHPNRQKHLVEGMND